MTPRVLAAVSASALALMIAVPIASIPIDGASAQIAVGISVNFAPPPLPDYDQPPLPGPGYIWIPGYWAWDSSVQDYYWVPGVWVEPPQIGLLWTPPYWGWSDGAYLFHTGYWGPVCGYYGGVDYGYGYTGDGYYGGRWNNRVFVYNAAVTNIVNVNIVKVYRQNVVVNNTSRASYNGGPGGLTVKPTSAQLAAATHGPHIPPISAQLQNQQVAQKTPTLRFKANKGLPPVAAAVHPGVLSGPDVKPAHPLGATVTGAPSIKPITPPPGMNKSALPTLPNAGKPPLGAAGPQHPPLATTPGGPMKPGALTRQNKSTAPFVGAPPAGGKTYKPGPTYVPPRVQTKRYTPPPQPHFAPPATQTRRFTPPPQPHFAPPPRMATPHYAAPQPSFAPQPRMQFRRNAPQQQPRFAPPPHMAAPRGAPPKCPDPRKCH
jgi:hypothetical protein